MASVHEQTRTHEKESRRTVQRRAGRAYRENSATGATIAKKIIEEAGYEWPEDFDPEA